MPILTASEYEALKKEKVRTQDTVPEIKISSAPFPVPAKDTTYVLGFPENPESGGGRTFADEIVINGRKFRRKVENGKIETREKELADYLVSRQYILLEVRDGQKSDEDNDRRAA